MIIDYVLFAALTISIITDLKSRRILNHITFSVIAFGLFYHLIDGGWQGMLFSGKGFLLGLALLLIPFALGGMGAGDVKLLAAIGALKGSAFVFSSFLYICLIGGVLALGVLLLKGKVKDTARRMLWSLGLVRTSPRTSLQLLDSKELHYSLPYAVPIALGTLSAYFWSGM